MTYKNDISTNHKIKLVVGILLSIVYCLYSNNGNTHSHNHYSTHNCWLSFIEDTTKTSRQIAQQKMTKVKQVSFSWFVKGWYPFFGQFGDTLNEGQLNITFSITKRNGVYSIDKDSENSESNTGRNMVLSHAQFIIQPSTDKDPNLHLTICTQATSCNDGLRRSLTLLGFSRSIPLSVDLNINKITGEVYVDSYSAYFGAAIKYTGDSFLETLQPVYAVTHSDITVIDNPYSMTAKAKSRRLKP